MTVLVPGTARTARVRSAGAVAWALVGMTVLALALGALLIPLRPMLLAVVIALFLAFGFAPLVDSLTRRGLPRPAGAVVATLLVLAVGVGAVVLVVAGVVSQRQEIGAVLAGLLPALGNLLGTVVNAVVGVFVTLFTCFFLLKDGHGIAARIAGRMPWPRPRATRLFDRAATTIRRWPRSWGPGWPAWSGWRCRPR